MRLSKKKIVSPVKNRSIKRNSLTYKIQLNNVSISNYYKEKFSNFSSESIDYPIRLRTKSFEDSVSNQDSVSSLNQQEVQSKLPKKPAFRYLNSPVNNSSVACNHKLIQNLPEWKIAFQYKDNIAKIKMLTAKRMLK